MLAFDLILTSLKTLASFKEDLSIRKRGRKGQPNCNNHIKSTRDLPLNVTEICDIKRRKPPITSRKLTAHFLQRLFFLNHMVDVIITIGTLHERKEKKKSNFPLCMLLLQDTALTTLDACARFSHLNYIPQQVTPDPLTHQN